ncbi:MAG: GNAT family N-acetyltransferase [Deltaproteobacteria bacterium]|jgi:ribosomal protein S18 acetylase RimI-like enzyme|nr:GNAT family N-acetyltransferase [Deltaproteobacteria bacterium]
MESASKQYNEATARILAGTLTLISREQHELPAPFCLWYPVLDPKLIKDLALDVAFDRSKVLWVDDKHPAMGLIIFHHQDLETQILGYKTARLKGPYVVDLDPISREKTALSLAAKSRVLAKLENYQFLSVKLPHDPSLIRGFTEAGFVTAEISTVLEGPIKPQNKGSENTPTPKLGSVIVKSAEEVDLSSLLNQLGDLFYDGHHLHSPFLPEDFSRKFWNRLTQDGLSRGDIAIFAIDQRNGTALGFAMAELIGDFSILSILHVNEDRRNLGLGSLLMNNLFTRLHQRGGRTIKAETASWNLPALSLYISFGLKPRAPLMALHAKI